MKRDDFIFLVKSYGAERAGAGRTAERGDTPGNVVHEAEADQHLSEIADIFDELSQQPLVPAPVGPKLLTPVDKVVLALARFVLLKEAEYRPGARPAHDALLQAVLDAEYGPKPEAKVDRPSDRRRQGGIVFCAVAVDATGENLQVMDGTGRLSWMPIDDWHKLEPVSAPKPRWEWQDVDGTLVARSGLWELRVVPSTREWQVQFAGNSSWLADPNRPAKDVAEAQLQAEQAALKLAQDAIPEQAQKRQTE